MVDWCHLHTTSDGSQSRVLSSLEVIPVSLAEIWCVDGATIIRQRLTDGLMCDFEGVSVFPPRGSCQVFQNVVSGLNARFDVIGMVLESEETVKSHPKKFWL